MNLGAEKKDAIKVLSEVKEYAAAILDSLRAGSEDADSIIFRLNGINQVISGLKKIVASDIYEEYEEFFDNMKMFIVNCNNLDFIVANVDNLDSTLALFLECLETMISTYESTFVKCECCGEEVRFLPLPQEYEEKTTKYGYGGSTPEFMNKDEYFCPCCGASDRDRMMIAYMKKNGLNKAREGFKVLQIAPSESIEFWIKSRCPHVDYNSTDLYMDNVTFKSDVQDMYMVKDKTYDLIICSHVLEHVKDDRKALWEFKRILKDDGQVIFLVPVDLAAETIDEEWGCSEEENWRRFGQGDHCRKYNKAGLLERLREDFFVTEVNKSYLGEEVFRKCALIDTSTLYILTKDKEVSLEVEEGLDINEDLIENGPLVTVILTSYNHAEFASSAVESILNQSYRNIEILVADDGSTDGTADVLKKYEAHYSKSLYFEKNRGTRFEEIRKYAKGKYIALLHTDDVWDKDKIAVQVTYLEKNTECGICLTWADYTDENLNVLEDKTVFYQKNRSSEEWMRFLWDKGNALCNPSYLAKREFVDIGSKYGNECWQVPDYFKWIDMVQRTNIHIIPRALVKMRRYKKADKENTSYETVENSMRHTIESGIHWILYIKNMDNLFFKKAFGDVFVKSDANSDEEIKCEKFFLMLRSDNLIIQGNAFTYLSEVYNDIMDCLYEEYNYSKRNIKIDLSNCGFGELYKRCLEEK